MTMTDTTIEGIMGDAVQVAGPSPETV